MIFIALFAIFLVPGKTEAANTETKVASSLKNETEASLIVESWMINGFYWDQKASCPFYRAEEKPLILESWMSDNKVWEKTTIETEKELKIENWMYNANYWKFN